MLTAYVDVLAADLTLSPVVDRHGKVALFPAPPPPRSLNPPSPLSLSLSLSLSLLPAGKDYEARRALFRDTHAREVGEALQRTGVFHAPGLAPHGLHVLFGLVRGCVGPMPLPPHRAAVVNAEAAWVVLDLLPKVLYIPLPHSPTFSPSMF